MSTVRLTQIGQKVNWVRLGKTLSSFRVFFFKMEKFEFKVNSKLAYGQKHPVGIP